MLIAQHNSMLQQIQFADAKAAGLITLVGLLAFRGPLPLDTMARPGDIAALAAGILTLGSILACLLTLWPRYPGPAHRAGLWRTDRFSWPGLTARSADAQAYAAFMQTAEISQIILSLARSNVAVSRILLDKFRTLRWAFVLVALLLAATALREAGLI